MFEEWQQAAMTKLKLRRKDNKCKIGSASVYRIQKGVDQCFVSLGCGKDAFIA